MVDFYFFGIFILIYAGVERCAVVVGFCEGFCCVGVWIGLRLLFFVISSILVFLLFIFDGWVWVIIIGIGRIGLLLGVWV